MYLPKSSAGQTLLMVNLVGAVLCMGLLLCLTKRYAWDNSAVPIENVSPFPIQEQSIVGAPVRLMIPVVGVDSAVESLGLTPQGAMDIPQDPDNVGWFSLGTRPGENGSAVMAGHYGTWKNGKGSAFDRLHELNRGDKLYVKDNAGGVTFFVVRESRNYDPEADATEVFSSSDGKSHLNLITCEGAWDKNTKSYSQRLVIFTDKE